MSDTVSENAKFNATKTHQKKSGTEETVIPLVDDYINKAFVPLDPEMDVFEAAQVLIKKGFTGLPVIDESKNLIGFLSEKDVLKHAYASKYGGLPPGKVSDFMTTNIITVSLGTEIYEVWDLFINNNFQIYPVTHEGKLVGVIQRQMALKAVLKMKDLIW